MAANSSDFLKRPQPNFQIIMDPEENVFLTIHHDTQQVGSFPFPKQLQTKKTGTQMKRESISLHKEKWLRKREKLQPAEERPHFQMVRGLLLCLAEYIRPPKHLLSSLRITSIKKAWLLIRQVSHDIGPLALEGKEPFVSSERQSVTNLNGSHFNPSACGRRENNSSLFVWTYLFSQCIFLIWQASVISWRSKKMSTDNGLLQVDQHNSILSWNACSPNLGHLSKRRQSIRGTSPHQLNIFIQ